MWLKVVGASAAALVAAGPMPATDRVVDVSSVQGVAALMRESGYRAEIKTGKNGTSYIVSAMGGNSFQIQFYGCKNDTGCGSFDFYSWFKKEPFFSTDMANEWNAQNRFLKVAIDKDGDLSEYLSVSTLGNMTYENFKDYFDWYGEMDSDLIKFVADKRKAASPKSRI